MTPETKITDAHVTVIRHPVVQQLLTRARDKTTPAPQFRNLLRQIAKLMAFEITRDYPVEAEEVDTPLGPTLGSRLARGITLVPILRAGLGMCDGVLDLLPDAQVGHVGIFRDEQTLQPVEYYRKLPINLSDSDVILIDPMLATAGSLCKALEVVREAGAANIKVLCLLAAPEGIEALRRAHGEVPVFTAAIDDRLDERGFILPGLGDAGDRLYGTD